MVEQIDVKCHRCNESCYGEVINTYGKYYHQYCFSCIVAGCSHDLIRYGYFLIDDELYCCNDYRKVNGIICAGCSKYVEGEAISALGSSFHPSCFGCVTCGKIFPAGAEVCFDGEDFLCLECNVTPTNRQFVPQLTNTKEPLASETSSLSEPSEKDVTPPKSKQEEVPLSNGKSSSIDKVPLSNGKSSSIDEVDKIDNNTEPESLTSGQCAGCENFIKTGQALLALDKQWHLWCFTCFKCGALLTGEYMGRDGIPYCEKDYQAEFGITCAGCGEYITGKVLQAGEKHYHPSCSRCAKCGEMFGEGEDMYLQGNEIWHPHCSEENVSDESEHSNEYESEEPSPETTPRKVENSIPSKPIEEPKPDENNNVINKNLNPVPFGQKPAGFRSVKPPGFRSVKPPEPVKPQPSLPAFTQPQGAPSSTDESDDSPPPVPPPPARSSSSQWRQKYASRNISAPSTLEKTRPSSYVEVEPLSSPESDKKERKNHLAAAYSTNSLNSNSSASGRQKGIGVNKLKQRINSKKDVRPIQFPTHIDPDRLRQFLEDPDHNVYLEDHEFYDLFKITREKFYSLPQAKKQELKSGILFS